MLKFGKFSLLWMTSVLGVATAAYYGDNANLVSAEALVELNQSVGAEAHARKAVLENPYDADAWRTLARLLEDSGRLDEALDAYLRASTIDPENLDTTMKIAELNLRLERTDSADSIVRRELSENPFLLPALRMSGWIALKRASADARGIDGFVPDPARLAEAIADFDLALNVHHEDAEALTGRGLASFWSGEKEDALRFLDEALAIDTTSYWAWQLKGDVLQSLGRERDAQEAYQSAEVFSENRPYTAAALATLSRGQKRFLDAADFTRRTGVEGAYGEGVNLIAAGDYAGAETAFLSALGQDPEDAQALDKLEEVRARIYSADDARRVALASRRLLEAAKAEDVKNTLLAYFNYVRAVKLAPQLSNARLQLARFYEKIGAYGNAAQELARVDELTRSQAERLVASDMLERITRTALSEMESVHEVEFRDIWDEPTSVLGRLISDPETLESRIRWGVNPIERPRVRIAVLPFEETLPPDHVEVGRYVAESLATTLGLFPGFDLVSAKEIGEALERYGESPAMADVGRVSRDLAADMVIKGRIFEERENVAVEAVVIRAPGGPVVSEFRVSARGPQSLSRAILEISRGASSALPVKGKVVRRQRNSTITVNLGRIQGIVVGDTFTVLQSRREFLVPGMDWAKIRSDSVAVGRVVGLTEQYCEILPTEGADRIRAGDIVARMPMRGGR